MEENTEQIEDMFLFIYEGKTAEIFLQNGIYLFAYFPNDNSSDNSRDLEHQISGLTNSGSIIDHMQSLFRKITKHPVAARSHSILDCL